ncbi:Hypothetical protein ERS007728_00924 [Mycobacterium tuberculosis]|nr:Hypothetical protein ERS007728_00924 [Mycobacterium tuberculosis]
MRASADTRPMRYARSRRACIETPHSRFSSSNLPRSSRRSSGRISLSGMRNSAAKAVASVSMFSVGLVECSTRWPSSWARVKRFRSGAALALISMTG